MCFVLFLFNFFFIELIESIKWKCNWVVGGGFGCLILKIKGVGVYIFLEIGRDFGFLVFLKVEVFGEVWFAKKIKKSRK